MTIEELLKHIDKAAKDKVPELDLSEQNLTVLPAEIAQLQNLTRLDLSSNRLSTLPAEVAQLQNLRELSIRNNQLSTLPAEIIQLQNLKVLSIRDNKLSTLPAEFAQLQNLTKLYFSSNKLSTLPAEIIQLQNLTELYLSFNQLSTLPAEIAQLQNLTKLDLHANQLSTLPAEIAQLQNLMELDLRDNQQLPLPPEVVDDYSQPQRIFDYYRYLIIQKRKDLNEAIWERDLGRDFVEPEHERPSRQLTQPTAERTVFLSYAWGGDSESMADQVDQTLQAKGIPIIRDKRDLGFKGRIKDFMKDLSQGKAIVVIISEKYLKSKNCMFELFHISKSGDFADRIFPIILSDAKIYEAIYRARYVKHWESKIHELDAAIQDLGSTAHTQSLLKDLNLYTDIRGVIDQLADILSDMNALTSKMHQESEFSSLIQAIEQKLAE